MPSVVLKQFAGMGLITDEIDYQLESNQINDCMNIRFVNSKLTSSPGYTKFPGLNFTTLLHDTATVGVKRGHELIKSIPVNNTKEKANIFVFRYLDNSELQFLKQSSSGLIDIFPSSTENEVFSAPELDVQWAEANGSIIINYQKGNPLILDVGASKLRLLENWLEGHTTKIFAYFKNFYLMLNNTEETGVIYGNRIRWSHTVEPPTGPGTDPYWIDNDPQYLAGFINLPDDNDEILRVEPLNDRLITYTRKNVYAIVFTGDNYVFTVQKIISGKGCASPHAVGQLVNAHLVADSDDIYVHDGNTANSISKNKILKRYTDLIEDLSLVKVFKHTNNEEIFIYYKTTCFIYNYISNQWSLITIPDKCNQIVEGFLPLDYISYDESTEIWQNTNQTWAAYEKSIFDNVFLYICLDDKVYLGDVGQTADGKPYLAWFTRHRIDLTEFFNDSSYPIKFVNQILPFIRGQGMVKLSVSISFESHTPIKEMQVFVADLEWPIWKIDTRFSGRYLSYTMEQVSDGYYTVNGFEFNVEQRGRR
jgi:hypothetical protein